MKLYHFTSEVFLPRIQQQGLTLGLFPMLLDGGLVLHPNTQWLTKNPSFDQPWHDPEFTKIDYDRRDFRITVSIPKSYRGNLLNWGEIERKYGHLLIPDFAAHPDHVNWYVFIGQIKPNWFRGIQRNLAGHIE